jgi:hypothetical protein
MNILQFRVLHRVFLLRIVDLELMSSDADPTKLIGQFASIFATISFFCTVPVPFFIVGRRPIPAQLAFAYEHFFIETTMTIAGLIAVLVWDSAFPDRRDVLILGPLPVRSSTLFLSKIAAFFAAPALAIISFNLFIGVGWPLVFAVGTGGNFSLLRTLPAYWFTIFAVGAFFVFTLLAIQGLAVNLLPRQLFLRLSAIFQAIAFCILVTVYLLGPSFNSPAALSAPQNQRIIQWLPAYWFLGLFNQLNGSMRPELAPLAHHAWIALGTSALGALTAILLAYFRTLSKIVQQPDILPLSRKLTWSPQIGSSIQTAITLFTLRTLLRSRQHRMILSFYLGIGLAIVVAYLKTPLGDPASQKSELHAAILLSSTLMMILAILAIRVVAAFPITLPANWIIRVTQLHPARNYQRAVRFSWLAIGVAPVMFLVAALFLAAYTWQPVLGHLITMLLLGILLVEICLYTFPKIPFACSYLPGKANIHFVFWVSIMFVVQLLYKAAEFESRILHQPIRCALMLLILATAAAGMHWLTKSHANPTQELVFEEEYPPDLISLKLN